MRTLRSAFFLVALLHGALYALVMPPWQAPDEVAHFEYSHLLAALGRPISPADDSIPLERVIIQSLYQFHAWQYRNLKPPVQTPDRLDETIFGYSRTLGRFSLGYVVYAISVRPFLGQDIVFQLYVMRLVSVVMGALVVVLTFDTARLVAPDVLYLATTAAALVLFLPQHAFITASVSDGNLAELTASACIFLIVATWRRGILWPQVSLCLACAVAAIFSKATAYFLIPMLFVVGPALAIRRFTRPPSRSSAAWRYLALAGLTLAGLGAVLIPAVLWLPPMHFIRNVLAYNADRLAHIGRYLLTLNEAGRFSSTLMITFSSFWTTFGWMTLSFPAACYNILLGLTALSVAGLAWGRHTRRREGQARESLYGVLGLAAMLAIAVQIAWFVGSSIGVLYAQGRYLFGAIVPIAVLLVHGWLALVPARYRPSAAAILVLAIVLFDAVALFNLAWPFYYQAGLV